MKTRNFIAALMIMFTGSAMFAQKADVDTQKSSIVWLGKKIGGQHTGNIQIKSGNIELVKGEIAAGNFSVDMTSITNTDLKDEGYNQKLVDHLKSDDFFGVEDYPVADFVVTESTIFKDGTATITGDLTIKGKTESISFEVVQVGNEYTASMEIDRSNFDVRFGSDSFFNNLGNNAIDDIFTLNIKLVVV